MVGFKSWFQVAFCLAPKDKMKKKGAEMNILLNMSFDFKMQISVFMSASHF
jgi:hypothetical protein